MREWTFGTMLQHRSGEQVMFLRWDKERARALGGGYAWFVGMRVSKATKRYGSIQTSKTGVVGNYAAPGFTVLTGEPDE